MFIASWKQGIQSAWVCQPYNSRNRPEDKENGLPLIEKQAVWLEPTEESDRLLLLGGEFLGFFGFLGCSSYRGSQLAQVAGHALGGEGFDDVAFLEIAVA